MSIKKLILLSIVSICISSKSHCMETVATIVKNEVVPAATIMAVGSAVGMAHTYAFQKLSSYLSSTPTLKVPPAQIKKGAICGAFLSIPVILASRFGAPVAYSWPNMAKLSSIVAATLAIPSLFAAYDRDYKIYSPVMGMSRNISASLVTPREAAFNAKKEKDFEKTVFGMHLITSLVSAGALLTKWFYT